MELYPQSPEIEHSFTKFITASLPMRLQVHPSPEIESWDTEYYAQRYDAEIAMLPLSLLFLAVAITDPSGSKITDPTVLSLTSMLRSL